MISYSEDSKEELKKLLSTYHLKDVLFCLRQIVLDEQSDLESLIKDFQEWNQADHVTQQLESSLRQLSDYCLEENFTPNRGQWFKDKQKQLKEIEKLRNAKVKKDKENKDRKEFERLKKKFESPKTEVISKK